MRKIYGFGETVFDIIFKDGQPVAAKPGGSVLNAFVSLGRLGWNPRFISEYARDEVGALIDSFLVENGVQTGFVSRFDMGKSALALAFLDGDNNASYSFYKDFPDERLQELPSDLDVGDIILFGSIYANTSEVRDSILKFLEMGKEKGALIVYDPNFRKAHLPELEKLKPMIIENIAYADIVRGSDEDFQLIFGIEDAEEAARLIDTRSRLLIYTQNSGDVRILYKSHQLEIPVEKIDAVSTIGAGDNFNAGIIHFLLNNGTTRQDIKEMSTTDILMMARTGVQFASHVCQNYDNYIDRQFADATIETRL
ncbi:carbohydrate kinase [Bacteroidota bacterium]